MIIKKIAEELLSHHESLKKNKNTLELGYRSLFGICTSLNYSEAFNLFEKEKNCVSHLIFFVSYIKLLVQQSDTKIFPYEYIKAIQLLQKFSEEGNDEAENFCARNSDLKYWKEQSEKNKENIYARYIFCFLNSALENEWEEMIQSLNKNTAIYAHIYFHLAEIKNDIELYQYSAKRGHFISIEKLIFFYETNNKLEQAKKYCYIGAELGNSNFIYDLASYYSKEGKLEEAENFYLKAHEAGHSDAYVALGVCILRQKNEEKYEEGLLILKKAGNEGNSLACSNLYKIYKKGGYGVEKNTEKAQKWLKKAGNFKLFNHKKENEMVQILNNKNKIF